MKTVQFSHPNAVRYPATPEMDKPLNTLMHLQNAYKAVRGTIDQSETPVLEALVPVEEQTCQTLAKLAGYPEPREAFECEQIREGWVIRAHDSDTILFVIVTDPLPAYSWDNQVGVLHQNLIKVSHLRAEIEGQNFLENPLASELDQLEFQILADLHCYLGAEGNPPYAWEWDAEGVLIIGQNEQEETFPIYRLIP